VQKKGDATTFYCEVPEGGCVKEKDAGNGREEGLGGEKGAQILSTRPRSGKKCRKNEGLRRESSFLSYPSYWAGNNRTEQSQHRGTPQEGGVIPKKGGGRKFTWGELRPKVNSYA